MIMGCYGIGISRVAAAAIEQNHDEHGIVFPPAISPFDCMLLNLDPRDAAVSAKVEEVYAMLGDMGVDVLLDDREERPESSLRTQICWVFRCSWWWAARAWRVACWNARTAAQGRRANCLWKAWLQPSGPGPMRSGAGWKALL